MKPKPLTRPMRITLLKLAQGGIPENNGWTIAWRVARNIQTIEGLERRGLVETRSAGRLTPVTVYDWDVRLTALGEATVTVMEAGT